MTNKEAIELLAEVDEMATKNGEDGDGFVALKIAIEALKRDNHDGCDGCEYEPKDDFTFPCVICKQNYVDMYEPMPERGQNTDVIWCKDCKHHQEINGVMMCDRYFGIAHNLKRDDFCSYGERSEE